MWDVLLARLDREGLPARLAECWEVDPGSVHFVSTGANVVFRFTGGGEGRYLRVVHEELRSAGEVEAVQELLAHLAGTGAPVCRPVPSRRGRRVERLSQPGDAFLATVAAEVPGRPVGRGEAEAAVYEAWGRALGVMHRAAEGFVPRDPARFRDHGAHWEEAYRRLRDRDDAVLAAWRELDAWLRELPRERGDVGLTHGDCNAGNALFDGAAVTLIDFDEPVRHWFAADLARPFRELGVPEPERRLAIREALVRGYRAERALADSWVEALPRFARLMDVEIHAWLLDRQRWAGEVTPGGDRRQEVLAAIRRRLDGPPRL